MNRKNLPILGIVGILGVMFIIPFVLAVITLIVYGEFALPQGAFSALLTELDPNIILGLLIAALPLLLVWAVEANRRRGAGGERTVGLTLGLLVALMLAATAVPFVSYLRPLADMPPRYALAILTVVALPLILILLIVLLLLPGVLRTDGPESKARRRDGGSAV
jgi:hypothetical protein